MHIVIAAALTALAGPPGAAPQDGLIVDRNRLDRRPDLPERSAPVPTAEAAEASTLPPFELKGVEIEAPRSLSPSIQAAVRPFIGETLDGAGVARLRAAASAAVGERAALPIVTVDARRAAEGALTVRATPGAVGRVAIYGDTDQGVELMRRYAARLAGERPLSRPTAERYLSLTADIPGAKTTLVSVPSATPGAVDLGFDVDFTRWAFDFGLNNRGSAALGRTQLTAAATLNAAFRMGDQTRLVLTVPTDPERFQYLTLSHRQPIGADGASMTVGVSRLRTRVGGLRGDATGASAVVSWPMLRGYRRNLVLSAGIDGLNSDNAVIGNLTATEKTRALRASAAYGHVWPRGGLSASLTVSRGLDDLGAEVNAFTDANFGKVNGRIDWSRALGRRWRVAGALAVQYSGDRAPTAELFSLGGADFGRGFGSAIVVGDSGYGAKIEAAWRPGGLPAPIAGSELYGFADGGEARVNSRAAGLPDVSRSLASAGLGLRLAVADRAVIEVEAARIVDDPRPGQAGGTRLGLTLTARF